MDEACEPTPVTFIRGGDGWAYSDEIPGGGDLFVRFDDGGRAVELYLKKTDEITPSDLRQIPLTAMRARHVSRPDFLMAFSYHSDLRADLRTAVEQAFLRGSLEHKSPTEPPPFVLTPESSSAGLTDEFLQEVSQAYRDALGRGLRPNVALAEQAQCPKRTVEKWVWLARKKGFLDPTRPGRVGR